MLNKCFILSGPKIPNFMAALELTVFHGSQVSLFQSHSFVCLHNQLPIFCPCHIFLPFLVCFMIGLLL